MKPLGTINENLRYAMLHDDSLTAHALLQGLSSGALKPDDPYDENTFDKLDLAKVAELKEANVLNMNNALLYCVHLERKDFAMYFAHGEAEVHAMHRKQFGTGAKKVMLLDYGMDLSVYTESDNSHQTWREMRDNMKILPAYAGVFMKR